MSVSFDIVIPTIGRSSLATLLESLERAGSPLPHRIIIVDDRRNTREPLALGNLGPEIVERIEVVRGTAGGPAAARNIGRRRSRAEWIAFVDDDVEVSADWLSALASDLRDLPAECVASTGRIRVPMPAHRKPTDWERNVGNLAHARWITADCAYRRSHLIAAGGFDERFRRAYREDSDLALRTIARGASIVMGERVADHPVRPAPWTMSVTLQAGNADDVLMDALHGPHWNEIAGATRGTFSRHVATVAAAAIGTCGLAAWAALTVRFAWERIEPGPATRAEVLTMSATSVAIPFAAVYHRIAGILALRTKLADRAKAPTPRARAVLFDRDGTLVFDVPYNADPALVRAMPGAHRAFERLREAGIATAMITNQSGVSLGMLSDADVAAVNARVCDLFGDIGPIVVCPHAEAEGCSCRKPAPGMIEDAARRLGVRPSDCVVVGDIGTDVEAALAAGARAVLIPTSLTRAEEISAAPLVAADLDAAIDAILSGCV